MDSLRGLKFVLGATLGLAAMPLALAGVPAQQQVGFVLTAYADTVGSQSLLAGHYDAAIAEIRSARRGTASTDVVADTNACVAYAVRHRLAEAQSACDRAVLAATRAKSHSSGVVSSSRQAEDATVAIAYANRAVVRALALKKVGSAEDLAEAHSLAPDADFVTRNIAAFRTTTGFANMPRIVAQQLEH
jgi:hypothetical protein